MNDTYDCIHDLLLQLVSWFGLNDMVSKLYFPA